MTDNTDAAVPKLVDFGLAKMIGPNEKADEPFGTLGYVAPEVLRKEPYSFSCDLWSLGFPRGKCRSTTTADKKVITKKLRILLP